MKLPRDVYFLRVYKMSQLSTKEWLTPSNGFRIFMMSFAMTSMEKPQSLLYQKYWKITFQRIQMELLL